MTEREKVIEWADKCTSLAHESEDCDECPYHLKHNGYYSCIECLLMDTVALLKEQEAKPPIHVHEEYPEHDWETDEDGKIDEFAMSDGFHNGPSCKRCYYSFCIICKPSSGWNDRPCIVDFYKCPKCGERILKNGKTIEHCINCGQAVKWE